MEEIRALGRLPQDVTGANAALGVCGKLAAAGDMRADDVGELATLRAEAIGPFCRTRTISRLVGSIRRWGREPPRSEKHAHDVQQDPVPSTPVTGPTLQGTSTTPPCATRHSLRGTMFWMACRSLPVCPSLVIRVLSW